MPRQRRQLAPADLPHSPCSLGPLPLSPAPLLVECCSFRLVLGPSGLTLIERAVSPPLRRMAHLYTTTSRRGELASCAPCRARIAAPYAASARSERITGTPSSRCRMDVHTGFLAPPPAAQGAHPRVGAWANGWAAHSRTGRGLVAQHPALQTQQAWLALLTSLHLQNLTPPHTCGVDLADGRGTLLRQQPVRLRLDARDALKNALQELGVVGRPRLQPRLQLRVVHCRAGGAGSSSMRQHRRTNVWRRQGGTPNHQACPARRMHCLRCPLTTHPHTHPGSARQER